MEAGGWTRGRTPLDWTLREQGGAVWTIRRSETDISKAGHVALFRMGTGEPVPRRDGDILTVEERHGVGVFRSPAEAKVMASMLSASDVSDGDLDRAIAAGGYEVGPSDDRRSSWSRWSGHTRLSVHRGGDESPEDVVIQMFHRDDPGKIHSFLILQPAMRGSRGEFPHGHRDLALAKALALVDLLVAHGHLRDPLDEGGYERWVADGTVPRPPRDPERDAKARHNAMFGDLVHGGVPVELARAALEGARRVEEAGLPEGALDAAVESSFGDRAGGKALAESVRGSAFAQYLVLALEHGVEGADALVEGAAAAPSP